MTQDKPAGEEYHLQQSEIMIATKDFREGAFAFVTGGSLAMRPLGHYNVDTPIPNGESAITALCYNPKHKKVYGATSGRRAHLFYYDPSPAAEHVVDIGVLGEDSGCTQLTVNAAGEIIGVLNPAGRIFKYNPEGEYSLIWTYHANQIHFLPVELGPVSAAAVQPGSSLLFGISRNDPALFRLDLENGKQVVLSQIDGAGKGNAIAFDHQGVIWGSCHNGRLFRYAAATKNLDILETQIPSPKGMEFLNHVDAIVCDAKGYLWGGTTLGTVFGIDTSNGKLKAYGHPILDHRIRAMVVGLDGTIYGCAGSPEKNTHLFQFNPADGTLKDLGIPMVHFPENWICYQMGALAVGGNGEIFIGEADRISHLFIYYPPVAEE